MTDTLSKPETARRALSILLVEDEAATLSALATLLSRRGHAVTTARDVHEALEQCGHDVVVTDLMLPSGTGLEVLAHMKSRGERPHAVGAEGDAKGCAELADDGERVGLEAGVPEDEHAVGAGGGHEDGVAALGNGHLLIGGTDLTASGEGGFAFFAINPKGQARDHATGG